MFGVLGVYNFAQFPKLIFHIINMSQDSSVSLSVPSAKTCRVVTMIQITGLQSKAISSVRQRRLETSLQLDCFPLSLTNSAHFVTLSTVPGLSLPTESQLILWHFLQSRGYLYWLKVDQFYSRLLTWPRFLSFSFFLAKSIYYPIIISCGAACWGEAKRAINYQFSSKISESAKDFLDIFEGSCLLRGSCFCFIVD